MANDEFLASEILGYGAYLCVGASDDNGLRSAGAGRVASLAERLGLRNEFDVPTAPSRESFALLTRKSATAADIKDPEVLDARVMIHVSASRTETVNSFCEEVSKLLAPVAHVKVLHGLSRPRNYTGAAMNNWAYARQVVQQPGPAMPNAFFVPLSKTPEWWRKDWMERHTYFLPRYDDAGAMRNQGHALAAAEGIACLLRRTYKSIAEPAAD